MVAQLTRCLGTQPLPVRRDRLFASRFLEAGPELVVPDGHYDPRRQVYVGRDDDQPAFVDEELCTRGGNEITTHFLTRVSGVTVTDPDNG